MPTPMPPGRAGRAMESCGRQDIRRTPGRLFSFLDSERTARSGISAIGVVRAIGGLLARNAKVRPGNSRKTFGRNRLFTVFTNAVVAIGEPAQSRFDPPEVMHGVIESADGQFTNLSFLGLINRIGRLLNENIFTQPQIPGKLRTRCFQSSCDLGLVSAGCHDRSP